MVVALNLVARFLLTGQVLVFAGLKIAFLLSRVRVQNTTIPILMIFFTISDVNKHWANPELLDIPNKLDDYKVEDTSMVDKSGRKLAYDS